MKTLLPLPTEISEIKHCALCALANMNPRMEEKILSSDTGNVPELTEWYIDGCIRDYRCLHQINKMYGMEGVEKLRTEFNSLPFIEKMKLGGFEGNLCIILDTHGHQSLNLLLFAGSPPLSTILGCNSCSNKWTDALESVGLGGSVLVESGNFPSCWNVLLSGKVDAILIQDDDGYSSKVGSFLSYQKELKELGLPVPPIFAYGGYTHSPYTLKDGLKKFLLEHFPKPTV